MASTQDGNLGLWSGYTAGDNGWTTQHNFNWDSLDALVQATVISSSTTTPPGSPAAGASYIVPSGATGAWASKTNQIAVWQARTGVAAWQFYTPKTGWVVYDQGAAAQKVYASSTWSVISGGGGGVTLSNTSPWTKNQFVTPYALTYAATVTPDASQSNNFQLVLAGNVTIANPTNLQPGMVLNFCIDQNATGGYSIAFGTMFVWPNGVVPAWSTAVNARNFFSAYYDGSVLRCNGGGGYA